MPQFTVFAIAYEAPYVVFCNINFEFPTFSCTMSLFFCVLDFAVSTTSEIFSAASLLKSAVQREPLSNTIQGFNHLLCNPQKCTRTIISKSYSGPGTFFCMVIFCLLVVFCQMFCSESWPSFPSGSFCTICYKPSCESGSSDVSQSFLKSVRTPNATWPPIIINATFGMFWWPCGLLFHFFFFFLWFEVFFRKSKKSFTSPICSSFFLITQHPIVWELSKYHLTSVRASSRYLITKNLL